MDSDRIENFKRAIRESLQFLERHQGNLSSDEVHSLGHLIDQLTAAVQALGMPAGPTIVRSLNSEEPQVSAAGEFPATRADEHFRLQGAAVGSVEPAVCITNPHGVIEWVNEAYCRLMENPVCKVIGTRLPSFPFREGESQLRQGEQPQRPGRFWRTVLVKSRKDGSVSTVEEVLTPLLNDQGFVTNFVAVLQDMTARKQTEIQMVFRAHYDPLTELPNRIMFQDRLTQALAWARRHGRLVAVLFLDLDRFKQINDEFGHGTGDKSLQMVAQRLSQCVRATDTVARLSGDEFTVILQDVRRVEDVYRVAKKILTCVGQPISLDEQTLWVKASLGIALYPFDGTKPQNLLQLADRAMYHAKALGGQCCRFASEDLNLEFVRNPGMKAGPIGQ